MIFFGWLLIGATGAVIVGQFLYFRRQRMICEKYPFYLIRDEIIWLLVSDGDKEKLLPLYERINSAVNELGAYGLRFHAEAFVFFLQEVLEEAYRCGFDPKKDWARTQRMREMEKYMHPLLKRFVVLLIQTARNNSFLLRLAMTRLGSRILLTVTLPVVLLKFLQ